MTRKEALQRISAPELDELEMRKEINYVCDKLDFSLQELEDLMNSPKKTYKDFRNKREFIMFGARVFRLLGLEKRYFRQ